MMPSGGIIILCRTAREVELMPLGTSLDHKCSECAVPVAVAPSSQRLMKSVITRLLCPVCYAKFFTEASKRGEQLYTGALEEAFDELKQHLAPNPLRRRN